MLKIIKEIFIYIILILLIALVFGILFYEQLPSNKIVPGKVQYTLPEKYEEELEKTLEDEEEQEILVTYTIEEEDLDRFEKNKEYNPGKVDPFADYSTGDSKPDNDSSDKNNTGSSSSSNDSANKDNSSNKDNSNKDNNSSNSGNSGSGQLTETKPGK